MNSFEPTFVQFQALEFIHYHTARTGRPPVLRELAAQFGIEYRAAWDRVHRLIRKGMVCRFNRGGQGMLRLTPWGRQQLRDSGREDVEVVPVVSGQYSVLSARRTA